MREPHQFEAPACAEVGGDFWFPERDNGSNTTEMLFAKSICKSCPHQTECAEWGIVNEAHGIWGGLVVKERLKIRRQRGIRLKESDVA
jgi:WhiB family transcriptional regulator, redox-sensing transcriptional regulator